MAGFAKIRQSFCASLVFVTALFFFKVENLERIMLWSFLIRAEGFIPRRLRHNIGRGTKPDRDAFGKCEASVRWM